MQRGSALPPRARASGVRQSWARMLTLPALVILRTVPNLSMQEFPSLQRDNTDPTGSTY